MSFFFGKVTFDRGGSAFAGRWWDTVASPVSEPITNERREIEPVEEIQLPGFITRAILLVGTKTWPTTCDRRPRNTIHRMPPGTDSEPQSRLIRVAIQPAGSQ